METVIDEYRTRKESLLNFLLCGIGTILWLLIFLGISKIEGREAAGFGALVFYAILFGLFYLFSALAFRANAMGNMILVSQNQFPHLQEMVTDGSRKLGLTKIPEAFVYNSNGLFNAFARQVFGRRYLMLTSDLLEATNDRQVRFVIGHELGHHAAGHLNFFLFVLRLPARIVPFLHSAYSRQCEYTCDRLGYFVSRDAGDSCSAIQMLGCGCGRLNEHMSVDAFVQQEQQVPPVWGFLTELVRSHPRLTRRVIAIRAMRLRN